MVHSLHEKHREHCDEELAPLKFGKDFSLLPLLKEPLRWGPIPSKSADDEPTTYFEPHAQHSRQARAHLGRSKRSQRRCGTASAIASGQLLR